MSDINRKPRNFTKNAWTGIQTPTTEQHYFFNRFNNISDELPHDQYLTPSFDQKTSKTKATLMSMKDNEKTTSKLKDNFVKNFELLDILLTIMEEDKDKEDEDEKHHHEEEEEAVLCQQVSSKCCRAYQKVLNLLPLYPNETNTEFLISIDYIVSRYRSNEILSLDKLLQDAMEACTRPLQLYFQGNKKKRLHGLRVLTDHHIEVMTDFPGDRLCCGK